MKRNGADGFDSGAALDKVIAAGRDYVRRGDMSLFAIYHQYDLPRTGPGRPAEKKRTDPAQFANFVNAPTKHLTLPRRDPYWRMLVSMEPGRVYRYCNVVHKNPVAFDKGGVGICTAWRKLVALGMVESDSPANRVGGGSEVWMSALGVQWRTTLIERYRAGEYVPSWRPVERLLKAGEGLEGIRAYDQKAKQQAVAEGKARAVAGVVNEQRWRVALAARENRRLNRGPRYGHDDFVTVNNVDPKRDQIRN